MITGLRAFAMIAAAWPIAAASPLIPLATRLGAPRSRSALSVRISPGNDRNTGPIGGANAVFTARWIARGRSSSRRTSSDHFTNGRAMVGRSAHSSGSVKLKRCSCWPAVTRIGEPAFCAS